MLPATVGNAVVEQLAVLSSHLLNVFIVRFVRLFKADFILGNNLKSFGAKLGEYFAFSISIIDSWSRNCLTDGAL
jgi:hypothetical protein